MQAFNGLTVETITNGPLAENCYLVADAATKLAVIIDPGDEANRIAQAVEQAGVKVTEILCTHGHIDHAGAVADLQTALSVPFAIHPGDRGWIDHIVESALTLGLPRPGIPQIDRDLAHDQPVPVGNITGRVLHTPGHTEGGCCFYFHDQRIVFVGDTLFVRSIGRTDLPGGSKPSLLRSIRQQLLSLDDDVTAFSGHGPPTSIGAERRTNPYLR